MGNFEALTIFCSAGHIAADIKSLEDLDTELRDCPTCGCKQLKTVINWPDEQVSLVPVEPIKKRKGILVYDVSKLFTEEDSLCYTTLAFFCPNGHLVSVTNQAERTEVDQLSPCEVCEATHLRAVKNWPESGTELVPKDPLKEVDENPIYEVKDLFSGDHPVDWEVHLDPDLFPILLKEKK